MQKSEKFFIFSWKELLVIFLLVLTVVGFFFTLGLHYGKNIHPEVPSGELPVAKLEESPETLPTKEVLDKGVQATEPAVQEAIKAATETAVTESNIKVAEPKPVELPKEVGHEASKVSKPEVTPKASTNKAPIKVSTKASTPKNELENEAKYSVQLGSYTSKEEAHQKIAVLAKRGLKAEVRVAEVNHTTRYRVVLPGFKSRVNADLKGKELKAKRKIESFIVIKSE